MNRPQFHPEKYRDLIHRQGEAIRWFQAYRCPCYNTQRATATPQCPLCDGTGWLREETDPPANLDNHMALVRGVEEEKRFLQQGLLVVGDVQITTMPDETPIGEMDLVILTVRDFRRTETIVRSAEATDKLKWPMATRIVDVRSLSDDHEESVIYDPETDYSMPDPTLKYSTIQWAEDGESPATGEIYSITYQHNPVWHVVESIGVKRKRMGTVDLPQKIYATLRNPDPRGK